MKLKPLNIILIILLLFGFDIRLADNRFKWTGVLNWLVNKFGVWALVILIIVTAIILVILFFYCAGYFNKKWDEDMEKEHDRD